MSTQTKDNPNSVYENDDTINERRKESKHEELLDKIQQLEDSFMGPSAGPDDMPDGHPSVAQILRKAEELKDTKDEENAENLSLYNEENLGKKGLRATIGRRRRQVAASGIIVTLFSLIAAMISFGSAPAQAIYLSKTMEDAHFFEMEDMGIRRTVKLMINMRYIATGNSQKLRLGIVGNAYADKLTRTMEASGFKENYTDRVRRSTGYTFDTSTISENSKMRELRGASPEVAQEYLKSKFDIDAKIDGGKLVIDFEGGDNRAVKRAIRGVLKASGYGNAVPAGRARLLAKRGGSYGMFHPMAKLDQKFVEGVDAKYVEWKKKYQDRVRNGSNPPDARISTKDGPPGANGESTPASDAERTAVDEGNKIAADPKGVSGKITKINTGLAAVGAICLVKNISNNIDDIRQNNVLVPMMRLGFEAVVVGHQIRAGKDVDIDQLGYYTKQYTDALARSWVSSKSVQYEMGRELTGKDIPAELQISTERNPVSQFMNSMDAVGLGVLCDAVGSPVGSAFGIAFDILGGPISAGVSFAFSTFVLPEVISGVESWIAGDQVNLSKLVGPDYGSAVNYGNRLAASESFAAGAAVPLEPSEELKLRQARLSEQKEIFQRRPVIARLFDVTDTSSLIAQVAMAAPVDINGLATLASSSLSNPLQTFGSAFSSFSTRKVSATTLYDYGFPKISYTDAEIDDPDLANPFDNAGTVSGILNGSKGDEYIERMKTCFNINIDKDGNVTSDNKTISYLNFQDHPECSDKTDKDWLRVRMYTFDTQLIESAACFDGVDISGVCENVGLAGGSS